jgi:hypothetical protein
METGFPTATLRMAYNRDIHLSCIGLCYPLIPKENGMINSTEREIITKVTHDLMIELSPKEEPLFALTSQMFFERSGKLDKDWGDQLLGFDTTEEAVKEVVFLTPILLSIMTEVINFIKAGLAKSIQDGGSLLISDLVKRMFKRFEPVSEETGKKPSVSLSPEQLEALHKLIVKKGVESRLSRNRAKLLADTIIGSMVIKLP